MTDQFKGEIALVTGGSKGIGEAVARDLALNGARVAIIARNADALARAADGIADAGAARPACYALDAANIAELRETVANIERDLGPISILINNAGANIPKPAIEVEESDWDQILDTNLKAAFFCSQAVGRRMLTRGAGRIVNIASAAGLIPAEDRAPYCASKAGLVMLTRELALEWASSGVTVNAVAPTFVETELALLTLSQPGKREYWESRIPRGRIASLADVVHAVRFLVSKESNFLTGVVLPVDGGLTMR